MPEGVAAEPVVENRPAPESADAVAATSETEPADEGPEMETFYVFTWKPRQNRPKPSKDGGRPNRGGKGKGKPARGPKKPSARDASAGPRSKPKEIDPDNPFAALAALKGKD